MKDSPPRVPVVFVQGQTHRPPPSISKGPVFTDCEALQSRDDGPGLAQGRIGGSATLLAQTDFSLSSERTASYHVWSPGASDSFINMKSKKRNNNVDLNGEPSFPTKKAKLGSQSKTVSK